MVLRTFVTVFLPIFLVLALFTEFMSFGINLLNEPSDIAVFSGVLLVCTGVVLTFVSVSFICRRSLK